MGLLSKFKSLFKKTTPKLPFEENTEKEFICEFSGHKFYKLPASPYYCNARFFYFIEKSEQINRLGVPNDYFLAIADQLEATDVQRLEQTKAVLAEWIRTGIIKARSLYWFYVTLTIIESFILVDNEDILEMSNSHNKLKRQIFTDNPDARLFFSNLGANYLNQLISDSKDINLESILKENLPFQNQIVRIMSHLNSGSFGQLMPKNPVE